MLRNILLNIMAIIFLGSVLNAWGDQSSLKTLDKERLKTINIINQEYENKTDKLSGKNHFVATFPTEHPSGSVSASLGDFKIFIWKENNTIWAEIEPKKEGVFVCSSDFIVIQNQIQINDVKLEDQSGSSFCSDTYVSIIVKLTTWSFSDLKIDPDKNFTLIYESYPDTYKVQVSSLSDSSTNNSGDDSSNSGDNSNLDDTNYKDSDNDGVINEWDNCPNTASGTPTDKYGCKDGFSQEQMASQYGSGYEEGFKAGQEECTECEQEITQADLDAQYEQGKQAGLAECENLSSDQTNCATVDTKDLRIIIPCTMVDNTPFKLWFNYHPTMSSPFNYFWKLDKTEPIE